MATHASILAWRIPWTEEPGGLCSPRGPKESDTTERLTLSPFTWKKASAGSETDWNLGRFAALLPLRRRSLPAAEHKETTWGCRQPRAHSGQILGKRPREVPAAAPEEPKAKAGCWGLR